MRTIILIISLCPSHSRIAANLLTCLMFQQLYAVEALATERGANVYERLDLRQRHSTRILDPLHAWMAKQVPSAEPKSPLGQALAYGVNQWDSMKVFHHRLRHSHRQR